MSQKQRSKTAEGAAACRAWHLRYSNPQPIFEDPFALELTSPVWRMLIKNRILSWIVLKTMLKTIHPIFATILGRARYTEDLLEKLISDGIDQYVILGAGLDSFALRRNDLATTLNVYEIDHPESQKSKCKRFEELKLKIPVNLEFIPVDFEKESVADGLSESTYSNDRPALFSWLGTTPYLTRNAIFDTLRSVSSVAAPMSKIVFDYYTHKEFLDTNDLRSVEALERFVSRRGEPFLTSFDPSKFLSELVELGYEVIENLSPEDQLERYYANRQDNLRPIANAYFIQLNIGIAKPHSYP